MSDEQAWEKQSGESLVWYRRFERFRLMEPVRSVALTFREEMGGNGRLEAPGRWYEMAKRWRWEERAAAWDAFCDSQQEKHILAEQRKVLRSHYALMHKRIELLNRKIQQLVEITDNDERIWLPDVKSVGTGPTAERVDLIQFNDAAFRELREFLTDVAEEMGGRIKKSETTIKSLPKLYLDLDADEDGSEP